MTIYVHLGKALEIIRKESDWRKWGPLIDALTPEQQAECLPWLRMQARLAQRRARDSKASPPASCPAFSTGRGTISRRPRAGKT